MKQPLLILSFLLIVAGLHAQDVSDELLRVSGELAADDITVSGGSLQDTYTVHAPHAGLLDVLVVSPDFVPELSVSSSGGARRDAGGTLSRAWATIAVAAGEQITMSVGGVPAARAMDRGRTSYLLVAKYADAGTPLSVGGWANGILAAGDKRTESGGYIDWYSVAFEPNTSARIELDSDRFDAYLYVTLADGREFTADDGYGTNSVITFLTAEGGVARVGAAARPGSAGAGEYTLLASASEVGSLSIGESKSDVLNSDQRTYLVYGEPGSAIEVSMRPEGFSPQLIITDDDGAYLVNDVSDDLVTSRLLYQFGATGTVCVRVTSYMHGRGPFTLAALPYPSPDSSAEEAASTDGLVPSFSGITPEDWYRLERGSVVSAVITPSLPYEYGRATQRFTIEGHSGDAIELTMRSDSVDAYLRLIAPSGHDYSNDDFGSGTDARLSLTLAESGTYHLYASDLDGANYGAYTLEYRVLEARRVLLSVVDELAPDDDIDITGKLYDVYEFTVDAGESVVVNVVSDRFDGFAVVRTPAGNILYRDDDSGGNSNPRLEFVADRSGPLELVVTSYDPGETGVYNVEILE